MPIIKGAFLLKPVNKDRDFLKFQEGGMNTSRMAVILLLVFLFGGCLYNIPTIQEYTKHWIGRPIEDMRRIVYHKESYASQIGWQEKTYKLDNGNWMYVEPDKKDCFIHWEVDQQGIIVGYRLEGNSCY